MDKSFSEFTNYENLNMYLQGNAFGEIPAVGVREMGDVDRILRQQWGENYLQLASVSYGMVKKVGGYFIFYLVYQTGEESLAFTILKVSSSKIVIAGYNKMYSSSESPRYIYGTLENVEPVLITQAKKSRAFQIAEKTLFQSYSHYLLGAVIKEILIDDSSIPNAINYNILYQTRGGLFLAVLDYLK